MDEILPCHLFTTERGHLYSCGYMEVMWLFFEKRRNLTFLLWGLLHMLDIIFKISLYIMLVQCFISKKKLQLYTAQNLGTNEKPVYKVWHCTFYKDQVLPFTVSKFVKSARLCFKETKNKTSLMWLLRIFTYLHKMANMNRWHWFALFLCLKRWGMIMEGFN